MFGAYKKSIEKNPQEVSANAVTFVLLGSATLVVAASFYLNFVAKQYDYLVEAPCDASAEECYIRDCEVEECPPNGLSEYSVYSVSAPLFKTCTDNSCANVCAVQGQCVKVACSEQSEVECSSAMPL